MHGTFRLFSYEDRIEGGVHMAMVMGDIRRDAATLVRVHVVDPLRDWWVPNTTALPTGHSGPPCNVSRKKVTVW